MNFHFHLHYPLLSGAWQRLHWRPSKITETEMKVRSEDVIAHGLGFEEDTGTMWITFLFPFSLTTTSSWFLFPNLPWASRRSFVSWVNSVRPWPAVVNPRKTNETLARLLYREEEDRNQPRELVSTVGSLLSSPLFWPCCGLTCDRLVEQAERTQVNFDHNMT